MTPREVHAAFQGAAYSARRQAKLAMFTAWHTGAFARYRRDKRLPELSGILRKFDPQPEMTGPQLRSALLAAHKAMGGVTRIVPKSEFKRAA